MKTVAYIYKWTYKPTGMWYIGSRTREGSHPEDGYVCSSDTVEPMIIANPDQWSREILETGEPLYIRQLEDVILRELDAIKNPMSFNRSYADGTFTSLGTKWMTKGDNEICVKLSSVNIMEEHGWLLGRSPKSKGVALDNIRSGTGENNNAYGKTWVTNGVSQVLADEKRKNELFKQGWHEGMCDHTSELISLGSKDYYANRTEEESTKHRNNLSAAIQKYHDRLNEEEKEIRGGLISDAVKIWNANRTSEDREKQNQILNGKTELCDHCGIVTNKGNYKRWHGNNCKKLKVK